MLLRFIINLSKSTGVSLTGASFIPKTANKTWKKQVFSLFYTLLQIILNQFLFG